MVASGITTEIDWKLLARVFDGGWGDHPELEKAMRIWSKATREEEKNRYSEWCDVSRDRINSFMMERLRCARVYGN